MLSFGVIIAVAVSLQVDCASEALAKDVGRSVSFIKLDWSEHKLNKKLNIFQGNSTVFGGASQRKGYSHNNPETHQETYNQGIKPLNQASEIKTRLAAAHIDEFRDRTMTKNLKVLVSSKDFIPSGLNILKEQHKTSNADPPRLKQKNSFTVLQSDYVNFGEEGEQNREELLKLIPGCSALVWISNLPITTELLDAAGPELKIVATASAGYNHCNVDELRARGIKLSNTPNVLSPAVAEITIGFMLGAARRFTENLMQVQSGHWKIGFDQVLGQDIRDSTVGIIGLGGIGQAVVKRLSGFAVKKVLYTGPREKQEGRELGAEFVSIDELLAQSDFIVMSVPLTDETRYMINKDSLERMKRNAILINVGRGELIDQDALYDALKSRTISAAALDVTTPEPLPKHHKLLTLNNLFVLPHIGSATQRTRSDMSVLAANNVVNALNDRPLITPVLP